MDLRFMDYYTDYKEFGVFVHSGKFWFKSYNIKNQWCPDHRPTRKTNTILSMCGRNPLLKPMSLMSSKKLSDTLFKVIETNFEEHPKQLFSS